MYYDIHTHILPAVDDGARNEKSTERMLGIAAKEGITTIVATPHFVCGTTKKKTEEILEKYKEVRALWQESGRKNEMYLGNELFYGEGIVEALDAGLALTMNGTKYVLVEFADYEDFSYIRRAVQTLLYAGYYPILAHIERYPSLRKLNRVKELVELGAYMQVNVPAVLGKQGLMTKWYLRVLLKKSLIHFVATDAHNSKVRTPQMKDCANYLKKLDPALMRRVLIRNQRKMLKGELIQ